MNTVTRCLAVIAATLVIGGCGGDPTAPDAGTGLHIRATPGAVWMRNNSTASVNVEAVDKLGGPVQGDWTVGTITGPFAAARDLTYQNTSAGALDVNAKFILTPASEGDGSIVINGTGGTILIPVRIAPDSTAFAVTISDLTPALGDTITVTAPAGTRFTAATAAAFYNGPLPLNLQQGATPKITSIGGTDSTVLKLIPPPGAEGQLRLTGISNISTPSLTVAARSVGVFPTVDVKTLLGTYSTGNTGVAPNTAITVTLTQPGYKIRTGAGGAADTTGVTLPYPGSAQAGVAGQLIDSTHMIIYVPPGYRNVVKPTKLFNPTVPFYNISLPMFDSLFVDSLPAMGLGLDDHNTQTTGAITIPSLPVGESFTFWDNGTYTAPNLPSALGGKQQWVHITVTNAGNYTFTVSWDGGGDMDNYLFADGTNQGLGALLGDCGSCGGSPETVPTDAPLTAGQVLYWDSVKFSGANPTRIRVTVKRTS